MSKRMTEAEIAYLRHKAEKIVPAYQPAVSNHDVVRLLDHIEALEAEIAEREKQLAETQRLLNEAAPEGEPPRHPNPAYNAGPALLAACVEFVRKVDAGEARSKRSYAQMKAALAQAEGKEQS